jgi:hypothetical protein
MLHEIQVPQYFDIDILFPINYAAEPFLNLATSSLVPLNSCFAMVLQIGCCISNVFSSV